MTEKGFRMGEGDWVCPDLECANINFARRSQCNRCGAEKTEPGAAGKRKLGHEIGTAAAAKSHGLFSADDWQCSKCANVNWARRHQCNVCNAPRYGELEERTGLGGGYNDRGVVEYNKRHDDQDDEYDEFGRRKKKRIRTNSDRSCDPDDNEENKVVEKKGNEEKVEVVKRVEGGQDEDEEDEEEEEDEDDDDGDLSKYLMEAKKPQADFTINVGKKGASFKRKGLSATTMALSLTLGLLFVNKFIWTPFKNDARFKEASNYADFLIKFEQEQQRVDSEEGTDSDTLS